MEQQAPTPETKAPETKPNGNGAKNGNGGEASTALAPRDKVGALLDSMKNQLQVALPKHLPVDRFVRVALTTIRQNPKLLECDRRSFLAALMTSAQLGLEPDGVLGHGYLVPYKKVVQFIPGYKGYIRLAFNSGEIDSFQVKEVREGDDFEYEYGFNETLRHVPKAPPEAPITHVWIVVKFKDGGKHWDVMTKADVDRIKLMSAGYQNAEKSWEGRAPKKDSPWHLHYAWMAKKTIIRQNARFLPLSVQKAAAIEDAADAGKLARLDNESIVIEGEAEHVVDGGEGQGAAPEETKPDPKAKLDQFAAGKAEPEAKPANDAAPAQQQPETGEPQFQKTRGTAKPAQPQPKA